jgi:tRNA (guanine-N7-)-methyltransferase
VTHPFWRAIFAADRPVEIELGPGRGEVLLAMAAARPAVSFLGIERGAGQASALEAKITAAGLTNVRIVAGDARCIVATLVPDESVAAFHVYFPDPWPKRRHHRRRLFYDREFAHHVARTLAAGGLVHVATDLRLVLEDACRQLGAAGLDQDSGTAPPLRPTTKFERRYASAGTHYACFRRRPRP